MIASGDVILLYKITGGAEGIAPYNHHQRCTTNINLSIHEITAAGIPAAVLLYFSASRAMAFWVL